MFDEILSEKFYGNTAGQWILAFAVVVAAVLASKALYWFFKNVLKKAASKTSTNLDHIIVDKMEEPVAFALVIAGIWYSFHNILHFSEQVDAWVNRAYYILIIFNAAWFVVRLIDALVAEYIEPKVASSQSDLDDQLLPIARKGTKAGVWILAFIVALDNAGYDVGALVAGLGLGGLAFALAAQDTIANLFGGFTIFADKPFKLNDRIQVDGYDGMVEEVGLRSTRIRTLDGRIVTIPNKNIAHNSTVNVSSEPTRKVVMTLGLTYDMTHAQLQQGMALLKEIGQAHQDKITDNVLVSFNAFGDFSLNLLFIYFIRKEADILGTQTAINLDILQRFGEAGLEFAFPSQTIYTKSLDHIA